MSSHFFKSPKPIDKSQLRNNHPFKILYVSGIELHKHQWNVIEAVSNVISKGHNVKLYLVGPKGHGYSLLQDAIAKYDPSLEFIKYEGEVDHEDLDKIYSICDFSLFASSCENMPNILLESMASGLPILSSKMGPMPEILEDNGLYFDPLNVIDIENVIIKSIKSPDLMSKLSIQSHRKAKTFSWENCTNETFKFINMIAKKFTKDKMTV